jgi:uncharacterized protein
MYNISDDDIVARMRYDNPWWISGKISRQFSILPVRDYFDPFRDLVLRDKPRRSVVLMGPRRTGKTVMLNQLVADLIKRDISQHNILCVSLDTPIYARKSLSQLLQLYDAALSPDRSSPIYIFFDEVQYLKEWELELKSLTDSHINFKFVVSGSAAAALKNKSDESGAGRFTDFILPPLTFAEFLRMTGVENALIQRDQEVQTYATKNLEELNKQFVRYLNFGGYPELALSEVMQSDADRYVRSDILDKVLLRDLPSLYGISDTTELYGLFNTLAFNTGNEVSLEKLSQGSHVSKNTLKRYLEYMEAAFLIRTVERVDKNAKHFERSSTFKVYLSNPSLRAALFGSLSTEDERFGNVAETAVVSQWMHDPDFKRCLRYARWDKREVDIVYLTKPTQKPIWAVEIKWSDRHTERPEEVSGMIDFANANPTLQSLRATTRSASGVLRSGGQTIPLEPTALYCYAVGKNLVLSLNEEKSEQKELF